MMSATHLLSVVLTQRSQGYISVSVEYRRGHRPAMELTSIGADDDASPCKGRKAVHYESNIHVVLVYE